MKNIRTLLIAVSALVLVNVAQAQTSVSADVSAPVAVTAPAVAGNANAPYSADPLVQKRQADSISKAEYKARKKAAKKQMKAEKKAAKSELKTETSESTEIRNKAMAAETPAVQGTTKVSEPMPK